MQDYTLFTCSGHQSQTSLPDRGQPQPALWWAHGFLLAHVNASICLNLFILMDLANIPAKITNYWPDLNPGPLSPESSVLPIELWASEFYYLNSPVRCWVCDRRHGFVLERLNLHLTAYEVQIRQTGHKRRQWGHSQGSDLEQKLLLFEKTKLLNGFVNVFDQGVGCFDDLKTTSLNHIVCF